MLQVEKSLERGILKTKLKLEREEKEDPFQLIIYPNSLSNQRIQYIIYFDYKYLQIIVILFIPISFVYHCIGKNCLKIQINSE